MLARGEIRRSRIIFCMLMWRVQSLVVGADATWWIGKEIAKIMNISAAEVEVPELVALGPSPNCQRRTAEIEAWKTSESAFRATERFRKVDNGERVKMVVIGDGYFFHATSASYDDFFRGSEEVMEEPIKRKMVPALVNASFVCPEDLEETLCFHLMIVHGIMPPSASSFGKMVSWDGEIRLFYFCMRSSKDLATGDECTVIRYEPAPPGKYLRDNPNMQFRSVVQKFLKESELRTSGDGEDGRKGVAGGEEMKEVTATPLACPPLSAETLATTSSSLPPPLSTSLDAPVVGGNTTAATTTATTISMDEHLRLAMEIFKLQSPKLPTPHPPPLAVSKAATTAAAGVAPASRGATRVVKEESLSRTETLSPVGPPCVLSPQHSVSHTSGQEIETVDVQCGISNSRITDFEDDDADDVFLQREKVWKRVPILNDGIMEQIFDD